MNRGEGPSFLPLIHQLGSPLRRTDPDVVNLCAAWGDHHEDEHTEDLMTALEIEAYAWSTLTIGSEPPFNITGFWRKIRTWAASLVAAPPDAAFAVLVT